MALFYIDIMSASGASMNISSTIARPIVPSASSGATQAQSQSLSSPQTQQNSGAPKQGTVAQCIIVTTLHCHCHAQYATQSMSATY